MASIRSGWNTLRALSFRRAALGVVLGLGLGACQPTMTATAPSGGLTTPGMPVAFVSIQGPSADLAQKFESVLAQEAKRRGFEVVPVGQGAKALRVKTYLDAYSSDGQSGFAWVMEASDDGRNRSARVKGAAAKGMSGASPWTSLDDATMRQIAQMSVDDLIRHLNGAAAVPVVADEAQ